MIQTNPNRRSNVQYVIEELKTLPDFPKIVALTSALKMNRTTFQRWKQLSHTPTGAAFQRLCVGTRIEADDFDSLLPPQFKKKHHKVGWSALGRATPITSDRRIDLVSTSDSIKVQDRCFERHKGSYRIITEQLSDKKDYKVTVGLLEIVRATPNGICFKLHRREGNAWESYEGLLFSLESFLYFFAEEVSGHEVLVIVAHQLPHASKGERVAGNMLGIRQSGTPRPMAWKVILEFIGRASIDRDKCRGQFMTYGRDSIPQDISQLLNS
jgi:hypothetical protein